MSGPFTPEQEQRVREIAALLVMQAFKNWQAERFVEVSAALTDVVDRHNPDPLFRSAYFGDEDA